MSLWCLVPRPPDGGRDYGPENRATRTTIIVAGVAGGLLCGLVSAFANFGDLYSAEATVLLSTGLVAAVIVTVTVWGRRRIMSRIPESHRVKPVSDRAAAFAAQAAVLLAIATIWTAGLVRIPIGVDGEWLTAIPVLTFAGLAAATAANFRLRHLARQQAASSEAPLAIATD